MSPTLNGSSAIWRFKGSNAIEICDGITFDFYTGLPHVFQLHQSTIAEPLLRMGLIHAADHYNKPALNKVQRYSASNTMMRSNHVMEYLISIQDCSYM